MKSNNIPKIPAMEGSPIRKLGAHLLLVLLVLTTIRSIEARRRTHKSDGSNVYTSEESNCDSDFRTPNTDHSETHKWRQRRPPPTSSPRIIGGRIGKVGEFPFVVRIESRSYIDGSRRVCTGCIIDHSLILTAAHCLWDRERLRLVDPRSITIIAGNYRSDYLELDRPTYYKPKLIAIHKYYRSMGNYTLNDIGLILTRQYIKVDKGDEFGLGKVDNMELPPRDGLAAVRQSNVTVVGWGWMTPGIPSSGAVQLMALDTKMAPCSDPRVPFEYNKDYICISNRNSQSTCYGDSGGPLFVQPPPDKRGRKQKPVLYGITSFGPGGGCNSQSYFTNVPLFTSWIGQVMTNPNYDNYIAAIVPPFP